MILLKPIIKAGFIIVICMWLVACGNSVQVGHKSGEIFTPHETDIVQVGSDVENLEAMDQFVEDSKNEMEREVRYVVFENESADPTAVYTLKARKDLEAGQSWVEISRDWNYDAEGHDLIEPQQCSSVSKDIERGAFYLNECFHTWEIKLMPIGESNNNTSDATAAFGKMDQNDTYYDTETVHTISPSDTTW